MNYLIADSGGTKTSWMFVDGEGRRSLTETQGINPVRDHEAEIAERLESLKLPVTETNCELKIFFYGAGCLPPYSQQMTSLLARRFPTAQITVASDLLGAAQALCGSQEGIACILGTGSNSCLYDGQSIVRNVSPLGYILGDEGSGAVLGRNLIGDLLKGQMSDTLCQSFADETGLTPSDIIEKVYRQPQPNRFLASLVPFLDRHRTESEVHEFLLRNFRLFFRRNVALYHRPDLPVSFVGGIAHSFRPELAEAARSESFQMGKTLLRPIEAMTDLLTR